MNILFVRPIETFNQQYQFLENAARRRGDIVLTAETVEAAIPLLSGGVRPDIVVSESFGFSGFHPLALETHRLEMPLVVLTGLPDHVRELAEPHIPLQRITFLEKSGLRAGSFIEGLHEQKRGIESEP